LARPECKPKSHQIWWDLMEFQVFEFKVRNGDRRQVWHCPTFLPFLCIAFYGEKKHGICRYIYLEWRNLEWSVQNFGRNRTGEPGWTIVLTPLLVYFQSMLISYHLSLVDIDSNSCISSLQVADIMHHETTAICYVLSAPLWKLWLGVERIRILLRSRHSCQIRSIISPSNSQFVSWIFQRLTQ